MRNSIAMATVAIVAAQAAAKTADEWKSRTIYQLLTDRFAKDEGSSTDACSDLHNYCGGTFKGIEDHLDYI